MSTSDERTPMTEAESIAAKSLAVCVFTPGSYDKRFAQSMQVATAMTPKQRQLLWRMVHRYRRQLPQSVTRGALQRARDAGWDGQGRV